MAPTRWKIMPVRGAHLILGCILICLNLIALGPLSMPVAAAAGDGSALPFPATPSASKAGPTIQESTHQRRVEPNRLPKGAPNILIVLIDVGVDLGSPVSLDYFDRRPFAFNGKIKEVRVELK